MDCALAGDSLTQISLTGRDILDQHHLLVQALITIILLGQVRHTFSFFFYFTAELVHNEKENSDCGFPRGPNFAI